MTRRDACATVHVQSHQGVMTNDTVRVIVDDQTGATVTLGELVRRHNDLVERWNRVLDALARFEDVHTTSREDDARDA